MQWKQIMITTNRMMKTIQLCGSLDTIKSNAKCFITDESMHPSSFIKALDQIALCQISQLKSLLSEQNMAGIALLIFHFATLHLLF